MSELTPWISGDIKPDLPGVYLRDYGDGADGYSKWNGREWMWYHKKAEIADTESTKSSYQSLPWRGLAQDPKVKK